MLDRLMYATGVVVWAGIALIGCVMAVLAIRRARFDAERRQQRARTRSYDRAQDAEQLAHQRKLAAAGLRGDRVWSNVPPSDDEHAQHIGI